MAPDPKWLEILKASGWQTTAIASAAAILIYANAKKLLPAPLDLWVIQAAVVVFAVCGCLALASIGSAAVRAFQGPGAELVRWWTIRQAKHQIVEDIPHMTSKEKEIIAYLLAKNQRMFSYTADGWSREYSTFEKDHSLRPAPRTGIHEFLGALQSSQAFLGCPGETQIPVPLHAARTWGS